MLFSRTNTTEATTNTAEESQASGKMGILKNVAIIAGTAAGIGGVIFGAKKLHDHFSQDYLEDFDDFFEDEEDDDQNGTTEPENETPVEDFNEVDTEETSEEESKEEETINETSSEETKNVASEKVTENKTPVKEKSKTEVTESETTVRLKEIKTVFETFKLDLSKDDGMSVLKKLTKIDEDSMIDLRYIIRDKNLTESERKLGDEILGNFLKEITKVIEKSERILNGSQVTTGTAKTLYEFLNTLRWSISSVATTDVKERLIATRDLAEKISEGETKTSDISSNETKVEDNKVSGETQTGTREVIPAYKDRTDKQDLRMSLVMDKLGELADRLDEFTTKGFDISTNHMVEIIESFDQEIDKTAGITWTTAEMKQVKAYELRLHTAVNLMYDKFVEEIVSSESINTSLEIKAADFEVVRAAYTDMNHVRVPKGFNVHVSTVTRAFEDLRKRSKKSENETQVSDKTVADVMDGCEAIIAALGDQPDAIPSNFSITHSIKILNDVYTKYPSWKDLKTLPQDVVDTVKAADSCLSHSVGVVKRSIAVRMNENPDVNELNKMHESLTKILSAINNAENLKKRSSLDGYKSDMIILKSRINSRIKHIKESGETQTDSKLAGENQTAKNCFDVFKPEHKETNKVEGETKTSTEPLSYTMAEKVAEAVKTGAEIQAPAAATNASEKEVQEIMRIINDIPNRQTPEKNDLRFLARCIGGHVAKIDTSDVSDEMLADLRNSVILFSGMIYTAIEHIAADPSSDVFALGNVQQMRDEFAASNILELIGKDTAKTMLQNIDEEIAAFTEKIKSVKTETAVAQEPEEPAGLPVDVSNELDNFKKDMEIVREAKIQGPAKAKEAFKKHLASYLVDPNVSDDIKEQIENVNASITNMKIEEVQTAKKENNAQQSGSKGAKKNKKSSKRRNKR